MPVELLEWMGASRGSFLVGRVCLDEEQVRKSLAAVAEDYTSAYAEYSSGVWQSLMLRNQTGRAADALSREYDGESKVTEVGLKAPYLLELIDANFDVTKLKSARLFRTAECGMIVGHTDYNEFKSGFTRVHVVLATHAGAFNAEDRMVRHFRAGEVWFLDGRRPHSAGVTTREERVHLVLDFDPRMDVRDVTALHVLEAGRCIVPARVERPKVSKEEDQALRGLAPLLSDFTFDSIFGLLARLHVLRDEPVAACYARLERLARERGDAALVERARDLRRRMLGG